jgi:hypothetical protein
MMWHMKGALAGDLNCEPIFWIDPMMHISGLQKSVLPRVRKMAGSPIGYGHPMVFLVGVVKL